MFLLWSIYKNGRGKKWEYENTVAACYKKSCLKGFFAHTFYIDIIIKNKYNRNATSWDYSLKTHLHNYNKMKQMNIGKSGVVVENGEIAEINKRIKTLLEKEKVYLQMGVQGIMTNELAHQHNLIIEAI